MAWDGRKAYISFVHPSLGMKFTFYDALEAYLGDHVGIYSELSALDIRLQRPSIPTRWHFCLRRSKFLTQILEYYDSTNEAVVTMGCELARGIDEPNSEQRHTC